MIKSAFIGFLIALAMLLPPILHFISGPLGPIVGGIVAGNRAKASSFQSMLIGLLMALFMVAPLLAIIGAGDLFKSVVPAGIRDALGVFSVVIVLYTFAMGTIGALIGGYFGERKAGGAH